MGRRAERQNLKRLRQGQPEAWEALICEHYRSIYRFVAYLTRDASLAEELTQETFTSAWAGIDRFKKQTSLKAWLHQIAYRKFIDSRRRLRRDAALMAGLMEQADDVSETFNPLHRIIADECWRGLYEAMHRLKQSEYIVIVLHYIQDLSFREMAKVLDEPLGTVKWQTSQALKKLKTYLTGKV